MADPSHSIRRIGREKPAAFDAPDDNPFLLDEEECQLFGPHDDPLGDFGLDDEEGYPDERDFWIERDDD